MQISINNNFLACSILFLCIVFTGSIMLKNIDQPFVWKYDYPSAHHSTNAINHIIYGLSVTKGALTRNGNPTVPENLMYSEHHPPALPLLVAASYKLFGISEQVGRATMVIISLINVILLYITVRLFLNQQIALISAFIFAFFPLQIFYATRINHEALVLMVILLTCIAYHYWTLKPSMSRLILLLTVFCIGTTTGWPAYYTGGFIPAYHLANNILARRAISKTDLSILFMPIFGVVMFGFFLFHLYWVTPTLLKNLFHLAQERIGTIASYNDPEFSNLSLLVRTTERCVLHFTLPAIGVAFFGLLYYCSKLAGSIKEKSEIQKITFILIFWLIGIAHLVLFRNVSWVHEFLVYYLMPPVAITTACVFNDLFLNRSLNSKIISIILFLLFFLPISIHQTRNNFWSGQITQLIPLAKKIEENVPENSIIFSAATYHPFLHPALPHYAHRDFIFEIETVQSLEKLISEWPKSHPFFLMHEGHSVNLENTKELTNYLQTKGFPAKSFPGLSSTLYDLGP